MADNVPELLQGTEPLLVLFLPQRPGGCHGGGGKVTHRAPVPEQSLTFLKSPSRALSWSLEVPMSCYCSRAGTPEARS